MAMRLDLDFVRATPFWTWLGGIFLVAGCALAISIWGAYQSLQTKQSDVRSQLLQYGQQKRVETVVMASVQIAPEQLHLMHQALSELALPWNNLFSALEQSSMNDVALFSLQPDSKKQQIIITGEAKNYPSILVYIDRLAKQPNLSEVYLQKHAVNDADKDKPVRFSIVAHWLIADSVASK